MTFDLESPPCPSCACPRTTWAGSGATGAGSFDDWTCPDCAHAWREHIPAAPAEPGEPGGVATEAAAGVIRCDACHLVASAPRELRDTYALAEYCDCPR